MGARSAVASSLARSLSVGNVVELVFDPFLYVGLSVSEMSAYSEAWWPLSPVPPLVEGGSRHAEVFGEVLDGQQPFSGFHGRILWSHPFNRISFRCHLACQ